MDCLYTDTTWTVYIWISHRLFTHTYITWTIYIWISHRLFTHIYYMDCLLTDITWIVYILKTHGLNFLFFILISHGTMSNSQTMF